MGQRVAESAARVHELMGGDGSARKVEDLVPHERIELRRIMEVGVHHCAARTVISLGGDVTNQLSVEHVDNAAVQAAHHRAVQTAVSVWDGLVSALGSFTSGLLGGLLGKGK